MLFLRGPRGGWGAGATSAFTDTPAESRGRRAAPLHLRGPKTGLPLRYRNVWREYFYFNLKNFGILKITLAFQLCGEIAASKR